MANPEHLKAVRIWAETKNKREKPHPKFDWLDLSDADLSKADLRYASFHGANFSRVNLEGANLSCTLLMQAHFQEVNLRSAVLERANAARSDFTGARLNGANLRNSYFASVCFGCAYLMGADLRGASIDGADLTYADLTGANLDGIVIGENGPAGWTIKGVKCSHFFIESYYIDSNGKAFTAKQRIPAEGHLVPGEFEDRFKWRPTIELIFKHGMPALAPAALAVAIEQANRCDSKPGLRLLDISARGGIPRAIIQTAEKIPKKDALMVVSEFYQQTISAMNQRIRTYKEESDKLWQITNRTSLLPAAPQGGRSKPMSKRKMMAAIGIDSYKTFNAWAKDKEMKQAGNRQTFTIRLDVLDTTTRQKLEKA
jgi:uncharacterized protein YjbI with pentapeptide repeats